MEIRWNTATSHEWNAATPHAAWQQRWAYGDAWSGLYGPVHRAEIVESGETVGLAQFTARRFLGRFHAVTCTRGPVWLAETDTAARREAYRLLRRTIPLPRLRGVFMTPDQGGEEHATLIAARLKRVMTPYSTATVDLTTDEETLRQAMQGKWRNRLRRAEDAELKVQPGSSAAGQYDWLLQAEAAQQRERRYKASHPALTKAWQGKCSKGDGVMVLTAKHAAERVAAMLFLIHGKTALYQIGWTNDSGRQTGAHNLLLWRAMQKLKRKGVEMLDLGGVDTVDHAGIARFKLGAGGRVRTLCGTWY